MAKYVLVYKGGQVASEDRRAAVMAEWNDWFQGVGGAIVDMGNPFGASSAVSADGAVGEASSALTGYSILTAESLDAATALAKGCPILTDGGSIEVYEVFNVM
jgi:hypothetical protein